MYTYGRRDSYRSNAGRNNYSGGGYSSRSSATAAGKDILQDLVLVGAQTLSKPRPSNTRSEADAACHIENVKYVASYNWVDSRDPTILVPGSPGVWRSLPMPFRVRPDSGLVYIDQNGARAPSCPLLPLFRAADTMKERRGVDTVDDWSAVDVVTDRNNLRKLLSWLGSGARREDFRIDVQLAGARTLLFQRWEPRASEIVGEGRGFGHSYEEHCTTTPPGLERWKSTGHHRVISYDLAGMKLVVRFEVDACYPSTPAGEDTSDALADALSSLSVSRPSAEAGGLASSGVTVVEAGTVVPQSSLIELKTRSVRNADSFDWADAYLQLYLGQTPHSIMGVHQFGTFEERREKKLDSASLKHVARTQQRYLQQLGQLLGQIQRLVVERGDAKLSVLCRSGVLQLVERQSTGLLLPLEVLERFSTQSE
ncbi:hypothetical protein PsYK624_043350 [Phanerochaete sordida]|uniref:Uncharacterized protein n=1 Tax=Phanerochaete sordida TaxID=48140 RepID=A0A9P3G378_9APHY|nr:hypothetical protein PsYK624_043350 [Phanerochaete sordida]